MSEMKRMEMVIEAESAWGLERGADLAFSKVNANNFHGTDRIHKHNVVVTWRVVDIIKPTDVSNGSILSEETLPPAPNIPDLTEMDIEEAKGIVGSAANPDELDIMEEVEKASTRVPGGRKGVFAFIERKRNEFKSRQDKVGKEQVEGRR